MKTYDPKQVIVSFAGRQISGFADGTQIKVMRNEDSWKLAVGNDGEGTRAKSNNKSGRVEITLMNSSDSNRVLSDLHTADEISNSGLGALLVKDNSGSSLHAAEQAWIVKPADAEYAREANERVWILETDNLQTFPMGN